MISDEAGEGSGPGSNVLRVICSICPYTALFYFAVISWLL